MRRILRALRGALRPQKVKYDHSWWAWVLGENSTPHRRKRRRGD